MKIYPTRYAALKDAKATDTVYKFTTYDGITGYRILETRLYKKWKAGLRVQRAEREWYKHR